MPDDYTYQVQNVERRFAAIESRVTVMESDVKEAKEDLRGIPEMLTTIREAIAKLDAQTKITWGFMFAITTGLISVAIGLLTK